MGRDDSKWHLILYKDDKFCAGKYPQIPDVSTFKTHIQKVKIEKYCNDASKEFHNSSDSD